jgi:hypothetical protein
MGSTTQEVPMPTQLPPRLSSETPGPAAPAAAKPAPPAPSARIPAWVRYLPDFPHLEGLIDDPAEATVD